MAIKRKKSPKLNFKTPKKKTNTPLRPSVAKKIEERKNSTNSSSEYLSDNFHINNLSDFNSEENSNNALNKNSNNTNKKVKNLKNKNLKRNTDNNNSNDLKEIHSKLLSNLQKENAMLRKSMSEIELYQKFLGIKISQNESSKGLKTTFKIERESTTGHKYIHFSIYEKEGDYRFCLIDSDNCSIPEYMYDEIEFKKEAFPQVFYRVMGAIYEQRTN